jgi:release factor glutamine methyltransferase
VDISAEALKVARRNAADLQLEAEFVKSDLFLEITGSYDIIVSNPPYIPTRNLGELMEEVRAHEPKMALDGKADGLYFYRRIIADAVSFLKTDGWLCLEIGYDQGESVRGLLNQTGYSNIQIVNVRTASGSTWTMEINVNISIEKTEEEYLCLIN